MKINHIKGMLFSALVAVFASGCSDDLGNYYYTDVNEVDISLDDELVRGETYNYIAHYDHMKFSPKLVSSIGITDDANYEFEWSIIPSNALSENINYENCVVCREREIDYLVVKNPGKYNCYFKTTDKSTGVTWTIPFKIEVTSVTNEGWLVLCEENGRTRLDLVFNRTQDEDMLFRDMLAGFDYELGKPQRIIYNYGGTRCESNILLVTDKDSWMLDYNDLHAGNENRLIWDFGNAPDHINVKASTISVLAKNLIWAVIDENDDIYTKTTIKDGTVESGAMFLYPVTLVNGETPFKPAPFIGIHGKWNNADRNETNPFMFYDQTHSQFLVMTNTSTYPEVMTFESSHLFDNPTGGRQMVWMEMVRQLNNVSCILQDPNTKEMFHYAIGFYKRNVTGDDGKSTAVCYQNQENYCQVIGPDIERAEHFAFHSEWYHLYYSVGNTVYKFDLTNPSLPAVKVFDLPGEEITVLKFNPMYYGYTRKETWKAKREFELVVGSTVLGKDESECGMVRFYETPSLFTGPTTLKKEFDGFGKIVDITCKEPK